MADSDGPRFDLAKKTLPKGLIKSIEYVFSQGIDGCTLVGGTALAGFYFGHRQSDDMDIFTKDQAAQKAAILATKSLQSIGASLSQERSSAQYYHSLISYLDHQFTVDIVLDSNLFEVTSSEIVRPNISVLSLEGLLKTKIATLVSRCGEKDLYDLLWLFEKFPDVDYRKMIQLGAQIDSGVTGEGILISVGSAKPVLDHCGFSQAQGVSNTKVYKRISAFRKSLLKGLSEYLHKGETPVPLATIVKNIRSKF